MANFQPKIYSLSTLNIRQHFNCDYRFHGFRTDFSGESGSGKSLVADIIQLILVGSRHFKSGTDGLKNRDTGGLALKSHGEKYGRGYIFINVEIAPKQYIAIGGYLETTTSHMQFFIVQAGYDFEETLVPMKEPLFHRDLLVNNEIESVENLEKMVLEKGYLKAVRTKKYHELLFKNGILAVDLSQNTQSLKSYAAIIRSFSRGKGFFTDSDALKTFLFGDDDQKQLIDKYRDEVQNIQIDQQQHSRLLEEIATIKNKEKRLERVLTDFKSYNELKLQFSLENVSFWHQENTHINNQFKKICKDHDDLKIKRILVNKKITEIKIKDVQSRHHELIEFENTVKNSEIENVVLESEMKRTKALFDETAKDHDRIQLVNNWFNKDRHNLDDIREWYLRERSKVHDLEILKDFENYLIQNKLQQTFEKSDWLKNYRDSGRLASEKLDELTETIKKQETQLTFSNLDNPSSLANWAIENLSLPLTIEKESMLIHFQPLSRTEPNPSEKRYLPFPARLFNKPIIAKTNQRGFWLELNGIYEYIDYVKTQHLNVSKDEIAFKKEPLQALQTELEELKLEYNVLKNLKEKLEAFPGLEKAIELYTSKSNELFNKTHEVAELTQTEFDKHILVFQNRESHVKTHQTNKESYDKAYSNYTLSEKNFHHAQDKIVEIESYMINHYGSTSFLELLKELESQLSCSEKDIEGIIKEDNTAVKRIQKIHAELFMNSPAVSKIHEMLAEIGNQYIHAKQELEKVSGRQQVSIAKLNDTKQKFALDHNRNFIPEEDKVSIEREPTETSVLAAQLKFKASYDLAAEEIEDKTILADYSVGVLAHKLLPTVFLTQQMQEELIGEQIDKKLIELTKDLQRIGSRKIEILHNVFTELQVVYNDYLTKVQKISRYLSKNQITGGSYATLEYKPATGYPDDWMKVFRKRLTTEMQEVGLFEPTNRQDIDDIMISVFREANGTREAKVEDLLNPRSYFDLLFEIKIEGGQSNSGSNGQTYTANALLCLARLSLIEDSSSMGLRIMPIDEAEGLGGNFEMLHKLAKKENYQIVTMSIETAGDIRDEEQYIYIMHDNKDATGLSYVPPLGIFHKGELTGNIDHIFHETN